MMNDIFLLVFNESSIQNRLVAGATVLIVFIVVLAIVATVLVLRTKNQDDLDKKTSNHLPLPLDYASNEGLFDSFLFRIPPPRSQPATSPSFTILK
jgi:preprotein translocase subunit SecY